MTTFTKVSNYIFRGTIAAALGTVAAELLSGGALFKRLLEGISEAGEITVKASEIDLSGILGKASLLPMILLVAAILSCVAFKASGKAASVFRTITLFGMAGLSSLGSIALKSAGTVAGHLNGTVSDAEFEAVKSVVDTFSKQYENPDMLAGGLTLLGMAVTGVVAAVLVLLTITSVVSVVKTVKADPDEE